MPWRVTSPMYERQRFVLDAEHTPVAFAELCRRYGISRKTGCQAARALRPIGPRALAHRSTGPALPLRHRARPHPRDPAAPQVLALGRPQAPSLLLHTHSADKVRVRATIHRIPVRHGRVPSPPLAASRSSGPAADPDHRTDVVWSVDFKGQFSWVMGATAIRSRSRMHTRIPWPARGSKARSCSRLSWFSAACFASTASPRESARITASRSPRAPSGASRSSASGGSSSASAPYL